MKITCTNGNRRNGISGSRITVKNNRGEIVDRFEVPKHNGVEYCYKYPLGGYGQRFNAAMAQAKKEDKRS